MGVFIGVLDFVALPFVSHCVVWLRVRDTALQGYSAAGIQRGRASVYVGKR